MKSLRRRSKVQRSRWRTTRSHGGSRNSAASSVKWNIRNKTQLRREEPALHTGVCLSVGWANFLHLELVTSLTNQLLVHFMFWIKDKHLRDKVRVSVDFSAILKNDVFNLKLFYSGILKIAVYMCTVSHRVFNSSAAGSLSLLLRWSVAVKQWMNVDCYYWLSWLMH